MACTCVTWMCAHHEIYERLALPSTRSPHSSLPYASSPATYALQVQATWIDATRACTRRLLHLGCARTIVHITLHTSTQCT
jgi:hypothetical protein